ncbi:MAG: hypothetical protein AAF458_07405 [Pseudomonadota bacterium]
MAQIHFTIGLGKRSGLRRSSRSARTRPGTLLAAVGVGVALCAGGSDLAASESARRLVCEPELPFYCHNIHVGCSGRSRLRTSALRVDKSPGDVRITAADGYPHLAPLSSASWVASIRHQPRELLYKLPGQGYLRVEADGRFSHRLYWRRTAWMTYGQCRFEPGRAAP